MIILDEKILIVDDEPGIRDIVHEFGSLEGFIIEEAADGVEALNKLKSSTYELVILDVMMPKIDGWKVCRELRKFSEVPVIMLTARGEEYDKLFAFEQGVDDYVVKPFSPRELMARVKAITMRNKRNIKPLDEVNKLMIKDLTIDFDGRAVYKDGVQLSLTPKEYELLAFFTTNQNKAFSREQLLTQVWGYDFLGDDRTIDTHVKMLRESLQEYRSWIVTVWGIGYKFEVK